MNNRVRYHACGNWNCTMHASEWVTIHPWPRPYSREAEAVAWRLHRRFEMRPDHVMDALAAADRVAA